MSYGDRMNKTASVIRRIDCAEKQFIAKWTRAGKEENSLLGRHESAD
jgi:hypothetical protein